MAENILVGLDGSPLAESVLPYITSVAQALGAGITLMTVTHLPEEVVDAKRRADLEQLLEKAELITSDYLKKIEKRFEGTGVPVSSVVGVGDAANEIARYGCEHDVSLVALATHGRSGIQRWVYGSVAEEVLHRSCAPVLLIRPGDDAVPVATSVSQIVAPLDGSPLAEAALPQAVQLARAYNVPLVLLRAVEPVYVFGEPAGGIAVGFYDILDTLKQDAESYLRVKADELRSQGVPVTTAVPVGVPAAQIAQHAQVHPGTLLVMATHGRTGLLSAVLGSVARRVVQQAGAPVLLIRPDGAE